MQYSKFDNNIKKLILCDNNCKLMSGAWISQPPIMCNYKYYFHNKKMYAFMYIVIKRNMTTDQKINNHIVCDD